MNEISFMKLLIFACIVLVAFTAFILKSLYDIFTFEPKDIGLEDPSNKDSSNEDECSIEEKRTPWFAISLVILVIAASIAAEFLLP